MSSNKKNPDFFYSYDPPSPNVPSEYDPPSPNVSCAYHSLRTNNTNEEYKHISDHHESVLQEKNNHITYQHEGKRNSESPLSITCSYPHVEANDSQFESGTDSELGTPSPSVRESYSSETFIAKLCNTLESSSHSPIASSPNNANLLVPNKTQESSIHSVPAQRPYFCQANIISQKQSQRKSIGDYADSTLNNKLHTEISPNAQPNDPSSASMVPSISSVPMINTNLETVVSKSIANCPNISINSNLTDTTSSLTVDSLILTASKINCLQRSSSPTESLHDSAVVPHEQTDCTINSQSIPSDIPNSQTSSNTSSSSSFKSNRRNIQCNKGQLTNSPLNRSNDSLISPNNYSQDSICWAYPRKFIPTGITTNWAKGPTIKSNKNSSYKVSMRKPREEIEDASVDLTTGLRKTPKEFLYCFKQKPATQEIFGPQARKRSNRNIVEKKSAEICHDSSRNIVEMGKTYSIFSKKHDSKLDLLGSGELVKEKCIDYSQSLNTPNFNEQKCQQNFTEKTEAKSSPLLFSDPVNKSDSTTTLQTQSNVVELKENVINSYPKDCHITEDKNMLSPAENNSEQCIIMSPPVPPCRMNYSIKVPPPIPPPPKDDEEEPIPPPIPLLPIHLSALFDQTPPLPPPRQYLLIPLTPRNGHSRSLSPPVAPPRSASLKKSTPPPPPVRSRQQTPSHTPDSSLQLDSSIISDNFSILQENISNSHTILEPVPEEVVSSETSFASLANNSKIENTEHTVANSFVEAYITEDENKYTGSMKQDNFHQTEKKSTDTSQEMVIMMENAGHVCCSLLSSTPPMESQSSLEFIPCAKVNHTPAPNGIHIKPNSPLHDNFSSYPNSSLSNNSLSLLDPHPLPGIYISSIEVPPCSKSGGEISDEMSAGQEERKRNDEVSLTSFSVPAPPPPLASTSNKKTSLISISPYGKVVVDRSDLPLPTADNEIRKAFASAVTWGWLMPDIETLGIYTQFQPLIQQGPQCGLVALSMASEAFSTPVHLDEILEKARLGGLSNHGEMFSASDFCTLAMDTVEGLHAEVRRDVLPNPEDMMKLLFRGDLLLVPYDSHKNHMPSQCNGHKSHWALVCGCLVQSSSINLKSEIEAVTQDAQNIYLYHSRPNNLECQNQWPDQSSKAVKENSWTKNINRIVILWRQGKSRGLIMSPLKELQDSNAQLFEYPNSEDYIINSVKDGLAGQVIVLHKME